MSKQQTKCLKRKSSSRKKKNNFLRSTKREEFFFSVFHFHSTVFILWKDDNKSMTMKIYRENVAIKNKNLISNIKYSYETEKRVKRDYITFCEDERENLIQKPTQRIENKNNKKLKAAGGTLSYALWMPFSLISILLIQWNGENENPISEIRWSWRKSLENA